MWKHRADQDFERKSLQASYRGLTVKGSIGMTGNISKIPWISYCADGQETKKGIYPALIFYGTSEFLEKLQVKNEVKKIVLAFGISSTEKPDLTWGSEVADKKTIGAAFSEWGYKTTDSILKKYNSSLIYKTYDWTDSIDYKQIQEDLDSIIDIYFKVLSGENDRHHHNSEINTAVDGSSNSFSIDTIIKSIKSTGLIYDDDLIKRFAYSLLTKPFVILSGLAGSGKTQLALAFAKALVENEEEQMRVVPVGADWTNREPLLGYPNALKQGEYVHPDSGVLQLLINSNDANNANKPFFLILDEMNLSYVERYFSDFLSAMESHEAIPLWSEKNGNVKPTINLPKNLFIIGTINVDETTLCSLRKYLTTQM